HSTTPMLHPTTIQVSQGRKTVWARCDHEAGGGWAAAASLDISDSPSDAAFDAARSGGLATMSLPGSGGESGGRNTSAFGLVARLDSTAGASACRIAKGVGLWLS